VPKVERDFNFRHFLFTRNGLKDIAAISLDTSVSGESLNFAKAKKLVSGQCLFGTNLADSHSN
jgi:hypothetical protein